MLNYKVFLLCTQWSCIISNRWESLRPLIFIPLSLPKRSNSSSLVVMAYGGCLDQVMLLILFRNSWRRNLPQPWQLAASWEKLFVSDVAKITVRPLSLFSGTINSLWILHDFTETKQGHIYGEITCRLLSLLMIFNWWFRLYDVLAKCCCIGQISAKTYVYRVIYCKILKSLFQGSIVCFSFGLPHANVS